MQYRKYYFFIILTLFTTSGFLFAQTTEIQFLQKTSQKPIQYANVCWQVVDSFEKQGNTITDIDGYSTIPVEEGNKIILFMTCLGYKSIMDTIQLQTSQQIFIEEDILNLEQVTITGTRTPHVLKKAPVLTQIISQKELENIDSETISDILEVEMPGIEMANHGGVPVMNMMGLETQYSLVLVDGQRMAKTLQKTIDYSRINTANIERIEIIRGASSALYGSDAMGGVINIITKKPHKKLDVSGSVRYQQRNGKDHTQLDLDNADDQYAKDFFKNIDRQNINSNVLLGFRNKNFYTNTFFNYKTMDAYKLSDTEGQKRYYSRIGKTVILDVEDAPTFINGFEDFTISQKLGYKNEKWHFELNASLYDHDEFDFTNDALHNYYRSYNTGASGKYLLSNNSSLKLSHNTDIYQRFDYNEKKYSKDKTHDNGYHSTKLTYNATRAKHTLLFELENLFQELETDKFIYGKLLTESTNDAVIVLQDEFQWKNNFIIVAGLRTGYHSTYRFHCSPSITTKYSLDKFNLRLSYARGFRSPDLKELYMNWSHLGMFQLLGNQDLRPETNNYYSFSIDFIDAAHNLNATLITSYNDVKDKIDGTWTKNETEFRYVNFSDAQVFSIETLLKWQFHQNFKLKAGYIFLNSKKSVDAQDLSTMSPMSLNCQLDYRFDKKNYRFNANLSGKITGKKEFDILDSDEGSFYEGEYYRIKYPTYSIWNITVNQYFGKHIKVGAGIKNILDYKAPIITFNTSNTPGRRFFVSLTYQL